ncbi:glycosyltransferase family 4 protein [Planococcus sp. ISL-109]|uniref:glycosyltransferase family 4 protein n=1 Tax=Planococcus sp. ISL-109 TaxID=2819166 RepID=UPI001BE73D36|nr:glycosyltransferase family 4 protein [Planococcus sp. ISL-109]MBT2581541.1 glycosyltransferase family 4 protein [Planococcus sp. ISL-109]
MTKKLIHAVTVSESLSFMNGQLRYLKTQGFEPKALSSKGAGYEEFRVSEQVDMLELPMKRGISPLHDLKSLIRCVVLFQKEQPLIVNAGTPKAGLVVTIAARICRVPVRIYTMRGLRLETTNGWKRRLLLNMEKLAASSATHCLAVSDSLKERAIEFGIANEKKISVLGKGSGDGFDVSRFQQSPETSAQADKLRERFGLRREHLILGFVGRLTKDKGVNELVTAFKKLNVEYTQLRLLIVGDYEDDDPIDAEVKWEIENNPNIINTGFLPDPVPYYHMMDVFVFLTKREGFGNVSIEAALCGLPVIASNVTGARNTIVEGKTGYLVDPDNLQDIMETIGQLIAHDTLRVRFGEAGREWANIHFSNEVLWQELDDFYKSCLAESLVPTGELN